MARPLLVTIPFSHYCERARWALDRAKVDYLEEGHVPGFHRIAVKRAKSTRTTVPVLLADGEVLSDSRDILAWADAQAEPGRELYPRDDVNKKEVLALEEHFDREIGPHIRRVLYFHILPRPDIVFGLMDQRTPGWQRALLRAVFPLLRQGMRRYMRLDARTAEASRVRVFRVLDEIDERLRDGRRFLVGDSFTAADLTLASLAGPAVQPKEHYVRYPEVDALPEGAAALLREVQERPVGAYLRRMYREHRVS